nr:NAD(P)-dependent alcohol dehydrogenase [Sutcliffiella halmapala]
MKAAVLTSSKKIEIQEVLRPEPKDDEVLIRVKAVGLCGSDIHYYEHGKIGNFVVEKPIILGHELSGEIVKLGIEVKKLIVGQRVSIEPGKTCKTCRNCLDGRYNLCSQVEFLATPPYDGAFCEYITIRADLVFPIPDTMSYETAALIEPFSVGLHTVQRGNLSTGETVVIFGMGPIGLMTVTAARLKGAANIIVVDLQQNRLDVALELGATHAIHVIHDNLEERINEYTNGAGVDLAIETAGSEVAVKGCISSVRRGGRVAIVGMSSKDEAFINLAQVIEKELDVMGIFRYHHTYPIAIKLLSSSENKIEKMITDKYSLAKTQDAFEKAIKDKNTTLKVFVYPKE